jgi:hypothetical protein
MGGDSSPIDPSELKGIVLQPEDLPAPFERFDEGRQLRVDQPQGVLADPTRFGREDGWKARFRRAGSTRTQGPLVVESRADVFADEDGAVKELDARRRDLIEGLRLAAGKPGLGGDGFVATGTQGSGRFAVRFYLVAWRDRNATGSVLANGFEGRLTRDQALGLARKQQARIDAAA